MANGSRLFWLLAAIGALATCACVIAVASHPERSLTPDSAEYLSLARNLREQGRFTQHADASTPELYRTPGYPAFVALFKAWRGPNEIRWLLLGQALLATTAAFLLAWSLRRSIGSGVGGGRIVVLLFAFNPMMVLLALQVLTETLFVFMTVLAVALLAHGLARRHGWLLFMCGVTQGAAVLVRPVGLVLLPVTFAGLGAAVLVHAAPRMPAGPETSTRARMQGVGRALVAAWLCGVILLPGAWLLRNGIGHGYWGISKTGASFVSSAFGGKSST
jgi:4-amino-4-deoxy-L-arabinose transferase-like glycosyltransferase